MLSSSVLKLRDQAIREDGMIAEIRSYEIVLLGFIQDCFMAFKTMTVYHQMYDIVLFFSSLGCFSIPFPI